MFSVYGEVYFLFLYRVVIIVHIVILGQRAKVECRE